MGLGQKTKILNKLVVTQTKMSTPYVIYLNKKKGCWKRFSQCSIQIYDNRIISDYGSVSIESLGVYWDGLNALVILYCILWGKWYVIVLLRDLERSWDVSLWIAESQQYYIYLPLLFLLNSLRDINIWLFGSL